MFPQRPEPAGHPQSDTVRGSLSDPSIRYAEYSKVEFAPNLWAHERVQALEATWHHTAHVWHRLQDRNFCISRDNSDVSTSITHGSALYRIWASHADGHVVDASVDEEDVTQEAVTQEANHLAEESRMTHQQLREREQQEERIYFEWAGPTVALYDAQDVITASEFRLIASWWKTRATWSEKRQLLATAEREFMRVAVARRFFRERCQHARSVAMLEKTYNAHIASIVGQFLTQGIAPRRPARTLWSMVAAHRQRILSGASMVSRPSPPPVHIVQRLLPLHPSIAQMATVCSASSAASASSPEADSSYVSVGSSSSTASSTAPSATFDSIMRDITGLGAPLVYHPGNRRPHFLLPTKYRRMPSSK